MYRFIDDGYDSILYKDLDLNEESVVFDVGGFKGEFIEEITKLNNCLIYSFEPIEEYFNQIYNKYKNNSRIRVFKFGLGQDNCEFLISKTGASSSFHNENTKNINSELALIKSATEFIHNNNIKKIDLIKINIEGSEYDLLESITRDMNIIKNIGTFLIQFHDFVDDAIERRKEIQQKLSDTHTKIFDYPFIWEKWKLKDKV